MNLHIEEGLKAFADAHFAAQVPVITLDTFSSTSVDELDPVKTSIIFSARDSLQHVCDELWMLIAKIVVFTPRPNGDLADHSAAILECGHRAGQLFDPANLSLLDTHLRAEANFGTTGFWVVDSVSLDSSDQWIEELRVKIRLAEI